MFYFKYEDKMSEPTADKIQIRQFLLYEFDRGSNATQVAKNICVIYDQVISDRLSRKWFDKFETADRCLDHLPKNERPKIVNISVV